LKIIKSIALYKHRLDNTSIAETVQNKNIRSQEEWKNDLNQSGADHELIKATRQPAGKIIEAEKKSEEKFQETDQLLEILLTKAKGQRQVINGDFSLSSSAGYIFSNPGTILININRLATLLLIIGKDYFKQ
jgi:hypothetical protein